MPRFGNRGKRRKSEYVRATALFKVDADYVPKGAKWALRGRVEGEYLDNVAGVVEKALDAGALTFSVVMWKGDENPVLSVGPSESKERGGRARRKGGSARPRRRRDEEDDERGRDEEPEDRGIEDDEEPSEDDNEEPSDDGLDLD